MPARKQPERPQQQPARRTGASGGPLPDATREKARKLAAKLNDVPEIRDEIVKEAEAALRSGKLLGDKAARAAALKLLRSLKK